VKFFLFLKSEHFGEDEVLISNVNHSSLTWWIMSLLKEKKNKINNLYYNHTNNTVSRSDPMETNFL
jgi:hypothetical protein